MKIQIDIPSKLNKKLNIEKAELEFKNKQNLIIHILSNYYGIPNKVTREDKTKKWKNKKVKKHQKLKKQKNKKIG
jgi:hypothetical protein